VSILFYDRPLKHGAAVPPKLGLRGDGTIRRSVAIRLHRAPPRRSASKVSSPDEAGPQSAKRAPIVGRCFRAVPLQEFAAPIRRLQQVESRNFLAPVDFDEHEPSFGSRLILRGGWEWLRLWRGHPRAWSPLPRLRRSGASDWLPARMIGLIFLISTCHGWHRCRSRLCLWLST
jgi:hypothetical protein